MTDRRTDGQGKKLWTLPTSLSQEKLWTLPTSLSQEKSIWEQYEDNIYVYTSTNSSIYIASVNCQH